MGVDVDNTVQTRLTMGRRSQREANQQPVSFPGEVTHFTLLARLNIIQVSGLVVLVLKIPIPIQSAVRNIALVPANCIFWTEPPERVGRMSLGNWLCGFSAGLVLFSISGPAQPDPLAPTWTRSSAIDQPAVRSAYAMAYDAVRGQVVLFGGVRNTRWLADTWIWDGIRWASPSPPSSPSARVGHAMAYDATRGKVVLFGGSDDSVLSDTWVWDRNTWSRHSPPHHPAARVYPAMAYDRASRRVILFGGYSGNEAGYLADTWAWDGSDWIELSPAHHPAVRYAPAMAPDPKNRGLVLFGGFNYTGFLKDTWLWNGRDWIRQSPAQSPPARNFHAMTYAAHEGLVILFGGFNYHFLADTWQWDGSNWRQQSPAQSPTPRDHVSMAYDDRVDAVIMFGGNDDVSHSLGDTWRWGRPVNLGLGIGLSGHP